LGLRICFATSSEGFFGAMGKKWEKPSEKKNTARRGNLWIRCEPEDAEVLLDGIPQGSCLDYVAKDLQIKESPGLRKIVVTKTGYWPYEAMVVFDRSKVNLHVQLQPTQASVRP
jgi:hypothetical protein